MTKDQAREKIASLVNVFEEHYQSYHAATYDEAKVRVDFINKFFKALGWDIDNEEGYAEAYREVILEDKLKIGGQTKAPDYGFTISGNKQRKFYVEAKKPSVVLKTDKEPAWQLKNYGWNAGAPISILTNFAEFAVYDCSKRPKKTDSAGISRVRYFTYKEYVKEFDFIWDTFSKESILRGRFDKFVQSDTDRRGTATVDKAFLESLNEWRKQIATSIAKNNHKLNEDQIGYVVQLTLDRLIFLRFCEDRGVEPKQSLWGALKKGGNLYQNLFALFKEADRKYNSGLFDFKKDSLSQDVTIDNKIIRNVVEELYPPKSEYIFAVLPVEILGNAYEQFLGKVIRITPGHVVKIDDKPEVRKAGGVYYTPQYIVQYIVNHTVGELIKGKTPKQIEDIKIVDPACGSGSFLLGAFEYLMEYHTKYYIEKGFLEKKIKDNPLTPDGRLTSTEKKRILINNIFGVDIDTQATEVTKLSLLLKAMEGETSASISHQLTLTHERILPNLDNNIKCGNSLIGPDFYDGQLNLEPGAERKINVFDWKKAFPEVFNISKPEDKQEELKLHNLRLLIEAEDAEKRAKNIIEKFSGNVQEPEVFYGKSGGFDVVIGNPPYGALFSEAELDYFKTNYSTSVWRGESYLLFIEKGLKLLRSDGLLGFIVPDTVLNLGFTQSLREYLLSNSKLREIVSLPNKIFNEATVDTILLFTEKKERVDTFHSSSVEVKNFNKKTIINSVANPERNFFANTNNWFLQKSFNLQSDSTELDLIKKIEKQKILLNEVSEMFSGLKAYEVGKGVPPQTKKILNLKPFTSDYQQSKEWKPFFDGKHVGRFKLSWNEDNWISYGEWLAAPRDPKNFRGEKILIRKITGKKLFATYVSGTSYCNTLLFLLKLKNDRFSYKSILAILNSTLIGWYFRKRFQISDDDTFPQIMIRDILQFPIPEVKSESDKEIKKHVDTLLFLNEEKQQETLPNKIEQLNTRIAHSEQRIDELVYELYGLTKEEIEIIKKETAKE